MRVCARAWQTHVDGADKVLGLHHQGSEEHGPDDGHDPGADETLDGLLGRQLDELGAAKGDAADVGEDVVGDDESGGEEEPDHALEDVVHDEVGLEDDEVEGHVRPGEVGELELVVAGLEGCDEKDEAWEAELACVRGFQGLSRARTNQTRRE